MQFAGKQLARGMSSPTEADWQKLKRLGRYLVGKPRMALKCGFQLYTNGLSCMEDSDYAGCLKTKNSTKGGVLMIGNHCLKTSSAKQIFFQLLKVRVYSLECSQ